MGCKSYSEHRMSSERTVGTGYDPIQRMHYRDKEARCEFSDCQKPFRWRVYGADPVPGDVVEHMTTGEA